MKNLINFNILDHWLLIVVFYCNDEQFNDVSGDDSKGFKYAAKVKPRCILEVPCWDRGLVISKCDLLGEVGPLYLHKIDPLCQGHAIFCF